MVLSRQERQTISYALMVAIEALQERDLHNHLRQMRELLDRFSD